MTYAEFLDRKRIFAEPCGFEVQDEDINPMLFEFQRDIVRWACWRGKAAVFALTGMGKGPIQLEWLRLVCDRTKSNGLVLAPLAVAQQFQREAKKFHIPVTLCRSQADVKPGINITNYERMDLFDLESFAGVALDESSCIKDWASKTTAALTERLRNTPYKLCSTATPSPNDHAELGTHAELLDVMRRDAMLAMFFEHDGGETSKWKLKGHGKKPFWKFVASWAVCLNKPSDLGYDDSDFILPPLLTREHVVSVDHSVNTDGMLFRCPDLSATGLHKELRLTTEARAAKVAELVHAQPDVPWIIWCGTNYEADAVRRVLPRVVEIRGSDSQEAKENSILHFLDSPDDWLSSKCSIFGYGLNLQHCRNMVFMGIGYSFEQYFQGVRRCWRFGQTEPVNAHIVIAETEGAVLSSIRRKESQYEELQREMNEAMREEQLAARHKATRYDHQTDMALPDSFETDGLPKVKVIDQHIDDEFAIYQADCVEAMRGIPAESIHFSISSPPFGSLYSYTDATPDMSNVRTDEEFIEGMEFMVAEMARILIPGRICAFHCMNLPSTVERDGFIGVRDFRGDLIRLYQRHGFIFHSEIVIWKDPLVAATRTHAIGLAHKQIVTDSAMCRAGIPDYLISMRKPGRNPEPVAHKNGFERWIGPVDKEPKAKRQSDPRVNKYSHEIWQRYASPVWFDINPSDTLQKESAREDDDSRHICPLQLTVIRRAIELWTNPGDIVFDPFAGIGSSGYVALEEGRCFLGTELKESYYRQARENLKAAIKLRDQGTLYAV